MQRLVDVVAAEGIGAAPVQAAILGEARQQRTPFRRAEAVLKSTPGEQYGVGVHGAKVTDCQVLAVDDTISTASSLIESIEMLRANNATVEHALGVVDRSQGKATQALANIGVVFHSLFQFDESTGQITPMV